MNEELLEKDALELINKADIVINNTITKVNYELINMYWELGKMICDYRKKNVSKYGDAVIERFSDELSLKYGKGFSMPNIKFATKFYKVFQKSSPANEFKNISWSHYREVLSLKDAKQILFYLTEINEKSLTKLEIREDIKSKSLERTICNQRDGNIKNSIEKTLKDPLILKIKNKKRTEKELENEIMVNIFSFMKEIGNEIILLGKQYKIINNGLIYKVDFVFYDIKNRHYILIDLKIGKVRQKDISQMKFYVDIFNSREKKSDDNFTIGIILVETKDVRVETDDNIYQVKYLSEIPKDKELKKIINENRIILLKTENLKLGEQ